MEVEDGEEVTAAGPGWRDEEEGGGCGTVDRCVVRVSSRSRALAPSHPLFLGLPFSPCPLDLSSSLPLSLPFSSTSASLVRSGP